MDTGRRRFILSAIALSLISAFPKVALAACPAEPSTAAFLDKNMIAGAAVAIGLLIAVSVFAPAGAAAAATVGAAITTEKVVTLLIGLGIAGVGAVHFKDSITEFISETTTNLKNEINSIKP